jgi:hypothetical protein
MVRWSSHGVSGDVRGTYEHFCPRDWDAVATDFEAICDERASGTIGVLWAQPLQFDWPIDSAHYPDVIACASGYRRRLPATELAGPANRVVLAPR